MAILSISICNKSSKIIFARQFVEMSRKQLEEHIVVFSRNVDIQKDSTYFENEKCRYLYIPIDSLFLILISTKDSNIIEDMEVIKLAYRLITDLCGGRFNEGFLINNSFELALALDDVVSLGYREGVNLVQVKQFLGMDSLEEKEFRRQQEQREKHAKEQLHIQMKEIEKQKKNKTFLSDAIGSDSIKFGGTDQIETFKAPEREFESDFKNNQEEAKVFPTKVKAKGLALGKKKIQQEERREGKTIHLESNTHKDIQNINEIQMIQEAEEENKFNPLEEPIRFEVEERIKGEINKDGEFKKFEIKGEGFITVLNPSKKKFFIEITSNKPKFSLSKIDKKLFDSGIISPEVIKTLNIRIKMKDLYQKLNNVF